MSSTRKVDYAVAKAEERCKAKGLTGMEFWREMYADILLKTRSTEAHKLMVALAQLVDIDKGLCILVREKIVDDEGRYALLELFLRQHPEIRRHFKTPAAHSSSSKEN